MKLGGPGTSDLGETAPRRSRGAGDLIRGAGQRPPEVLAASASSLVSYGPETIRSDPTSRTHHLLFFRLRTRVATLFTSFPLRHRPHLARTADLLPCRSRVGVQAQGTRGRCVIVRQCAGQRSRVPERPNCGAYPAALSARWPQVFRAVPKINSFGSEPVEARMAAGDELT